MCKAYQNSNALGDDADDDDVGNVSGSSAFKLNVKLNAGKRIVAVDNFQTVDYKTELKMGYIEDLGEQVTAKQWEYIRHEEQLVSSRK